jgi:hypothetical protein
MHCGCGKAAALRDKAYERGRSSRRLKGSTAPCSHVEASEPCYQTNSSITHGRTGARFRSVVADSHVDARSSQPEVQAARHIAAHGHILQQMRMFSAIAVRVDGASQLRPSSRNGSAAGRCSLHGPANGLLRAECPCARTHKAPRTLKCRRVTASPGVCVTACTCRRRAEGGMDCRESERSRLEHRVLLIRDGECNRHAQQESYFCAVAEGGWMGGVAEQRGFELGLVAAKRWAPVRPHLRSRSRSRHSLLLPLRGLLSLLCSSQPSLATGSSPSNISITLLCIISPYSPRLATSHATPCPTHYHLNPDAHIRRPRPPTTRSSFAPVSAIAVFASLQPVRSRVRRVYPFARRVEYGPVRLAAGCKRGCEPESTHLRCEAAPYQGAARCARAALPGAAQAQHPRQEGLRLEARRAVGQD